MRTKTINALRIRSIHPGYAVLCVVLTLSACANTQQDQAYQQGWRSAKVLQIGEFKSEMEGVIAKDCRSELGASAGYTRYASVSYSYGGNPNLRSKRVVAVPEKLTLQAGQSVQVNITDCRVPLALD
jgi:hypothetical protein